MPNPSSSYPISLGHRAFQGVLCLLNRESFFDAIPPPLKKRHFGASKLYVLDQQSFKRFCAAKCQCHLVLYSKKKPEEQDDGMRSVWSSGMNIRETAFFFF